MSITITGASDDVVCVSGHVAEEYDAVTDAVTLDIRDDAGAGMWVRMEYGEMDDHEGGWSAHVGLLGDGVPIPWPVTITHHPQRSYAVQVHVDCPTTVTVERCHDL